VLFYLLFYCAAPFAKLLFAFPWFGLAWLGSTRLGLAWLVAVSGLRGLASPRFDENV